MAGLEDEEIAARAASITTPGDGDDIAEEPSLRVPPITEDDKSTDEDDLFDDKEVLKKYEDEEDIDSKNKDCNGEEDDVAPSSDTAAANTSPEDALLSAVSHKVSGNDYFKAGDWDNAVRSYRRGTNALKHFNQQNSGDEQIKSLLITLQTNLSMVTYKQEKYKMSRDLANKALIIDDTNVKALYRRAMAHRSLGDLESARDDLRAALKGESNNVAVKKELIAVKKILDERKAKEKAGLQRAFSNRGSLLYSDKEEEEKRKEEQQKEKERLEAEATENRRKEWEDECVKLLASDPPQEVVSFEEWDKQRRKTEEKAEKARKKAKKAEEKRHREERRKAMGDAKAPNSVDDADEDDDDVLTEKELATLRGYKKTSDGRTTSYFTREQTDHEKELIGSIAPKRLDDSSSSLPSPNLISDLGGAGGGPSAWNASGTTWEEKDTTDWCTKALEQCLLDTTSAHYSSTSSKTFIAVVKKVTDVKGDASVAIAGGKKRYIYDYHVDGIEYEISDADGGANVVASGSIRLPEVHSANTSSSNEEELEVEVLAWKIAPEDEDTEASLVQDCVECRKVMVADVRKSVLAFVEKFNVNF